MLNNSPWAFSVHKNTLARQCVACLETLSPALKLTVLVIAIKQIESIEIQLKYPPLS
jgi:hypothetical protein